MKSGQKRMVHSTVWESGQVAKLSRDARLLYIGLITLGDDDGRLKGSAALIRSQVFPYDDDVKVGDVAQWISEIKAQRLLVSYDVEGEEYLFHPKWEEYQHIREDRRRDSHIPAPALDFLPMATIRQPNGNQMGDKVPPKISKVKISKENINTVGHDEAFAIFWEKYPRKIGKKAAWKAWAKIAWTRDLHERIMTSLTAACTSEQWTKDSGRYIPHAATWLNGERWEDELTPGKAKNTKYEKVGRTA